MANDKAFKIKNGLTAGRLLQSSTAMSALDIDLSTGSFFSKTLTGDSTFTISNPPASGTGMGFMVAVTGGGAPGVQNSSYDNKLDDFSSQTNSGRGIAWKTDGTRYYLASEGVAANRRVYQYNLTTAWDVSTAAYSTVGDISAQSSAAKGLAFKPDGTKMYVVDDDYNSVFQYSLSTAWAVNTLSYDSKSYVTTGYENNPTDVTFKPDGTKMYVIGRDGDEINEFTLSTAWDVSTASYSQVKSVAAQNTSPEGMDFNSDGTFLIIAGDGTTPTIYSYNLSTAYDISTMTFNDSFDVSSVVNQNDLRGVVFGNSDTKFYTTDNQDDEINQFSVAGPAGQITWPSSIKWPGGSSPSSPSVDQVNTYVFVTSDGGTTYYGKISGASMA